MMSSSKNQSFISIWPVKKIVHLGLLMGFLSLFSILFIDQALTRWIYETFQGGLDRGAHVITFFGLGDLYFLISVTGYLLARIFTKNFREIRLLRNLVEARHQFLFMFLSFLISGSMVLVLKALFGRSRPYNSVQFNPIHFEPFNLNWDFQSYPSGHSQVGFTLASFLSVLYPTFSKYFFGFATLIACSRIILEKHYLGDVLAGAYVGILGTYLAWNWKGKALIPSRKSGDPKN